MLNVEQRVCSYKKKIHNWGDELNPFPTLLFSASLLPGTNNCDELRNRRNLKKKKKILVCGNIVIFIPIRILLEEMSKNKKKHCTNNHACSGELKNKLMVEGF
jgi:hypothetical protein